MIQFREGIGPKELLFTLNGLRVRVYWNLRKETYSIQLMESKANLEKRFINSELRGKVIAYGTDFQMDDVNFVVNESGRQRVIRTGCKNVHAFVDGKLNLIAVVPWEDLLHTEIVQYNPYKRDCFYSYESNKPIAYAERVMLTSIIRPRIYAVGTYSPVRD